MAVQDDQMPPPKVRAKLSLAVARRRGLPSKRGKRLSEWHPKVIVLFKVPQRRT